MNKEKEIKIMKERAAELAKPIAKRDTSHDVEFVLFSLAGNEKYGIAYDFVEGIIKPEAVALVPCAPGAIAGVVSWRGNLLAVVDVSVLFTAAAQPRRPHPWVIVIQHSGKRLGLLVSSVMSSQVFSKLDLTPNAASERDQKAEYIQGVIGENIAILKIEAFLSSKDLMF